MLIPYACTFRTGYSVLVPWVSFGFIILCCLAFVAQPALPAPGEPWGTSARSFYETFAIVPDALSPMAFITSAFLHGNWVHLLVNLVAFAAFAPFVEDAMGHRRFAAFLLCACIVSGACHVLGAAGSDLPALGASGVLAAAAAAFLMLYPFGHMRALLILPLFIPIPLKLPAVLLLCLWAGLVVIQIAAGLDSNVSHWGHLGGLLAGALMIPLLKWPHVPLFHD